MLCSVDVFTKSSVGECSCYPAWMCVFCFFITQRTSIPKIRSSNISHEEQDQVHVHVLSLILLSSKCPVKPAFSRDVGLCL